MIKRALLCVGLALVGALMWARLTAVPCSTGECWELHQAMHEGTALSPWRYRVLLTIVPSQSASLAQTGFGILHFAAFAVLYALLSAYSRSAAPALFVAAVVPTMLAAPWGWVGAMTVLETASWVGLLILARERERWRWARSAALALALAAALNRETAVFLAALWLLVTREWGWAAAIGAITAGVFVGLRLLLGTAADSVPIADAWRMNTGGGWHTQNAILNLGVLVPFFAYALMQRGDETARRGVWVGAVYLPVVAIFGLWNETRLLLPLLAVAALRLR